MEHLPDPTPKSAGEGKDPLAGIGLSGVLLLEIRGGHRSEVLFDLGQGGLTNGTGQAGGAPAQGSEARAPGGEKWRGHVQYIYWTDLTRQLKCSL